MTPDLAALTDGELAALAIAGRDAGFAALMQRHRDPLFRLIRSHIGDAEEALDLTQETFVAAHRNLSRYDPARPMRAWLAAIALNRCRDWHRRRRVRAWFGRAAPVTADALDAIRDPGPDPETIAATRADLARLSAAITALPRPLREVLLLRTIEDLSQAETARTLGLSEKAVETRLYRARRTLAATIEIR